MDKIEIKCISFGNVHYILEHNSDLYLYHPVGGDQYCAVYFVETTNNYNMGLDKNSTVMFQITLVCCSRLQICRLCVAFVNNYIDEMACPLCALNVGLFASGANCHLQDINVLGQYLKTKVATNYYHFPINIMIVYNRVAHLNPMINTSLPPLSSTKLKGGILASCCPFAHPSVRPCVDGIVSALYLQQYSLDLVLIQHINQIE